MSSSLGTNASTSYAPSAPPAMPEPSYSSSYGEECQSYDRPYGKFGSYHQYQQPSFPPGTHPDVVRSFEMVDRDRSGFIDENELQEALSPGYQRFRLRSIRLLMFLFKNPHDSLRIGPSEFAALWNCLSQWRAIFERYDRDQSGKIDAMELRDALYGLGYAIPASVLQILISHYGDGTGQKVELDFGSFVECGMVVKGLTEKFKEKDRHYSGFATFTYDTFMTMVLPFLVSYN